VGWELLEAYEGFTIPNNSAMKASALAIKIVFLMLGSCDQYHVACKRGVWGGSKQET